MKLTDLEKAKLRDVMPLLTKLQQEFRGLSFQYPDLRDPKYAECFISLEARGAKVFEDVGLIRFVEIESKELNA